MKEQLFLPTCSCSAPKRKRRKNIHRKLNEMKRKTFCPGATNINLSFLEVSLGRSLKALIKRNLAEQSRPQGPTQFRNVSKLIIYFQHSGVIDSHLSSAIKAGKEQQRGR